MTTILNELFPSWLNNFFMLLTTPAYTGEWFHFQWGWGIVHFVIVFVLTLLILKKKIKYPILWVISLILLFEAFEFLFSNIIPLLLIDTWQDTAADIVVGLVAMVIALLAFKD